MGIVDGDVILLHEVAIEGGEVASYSECKAEDREGNVWEREGGFCEREVLRGMVDEGGKRMYADAGYDGEGFEVEKIVDGKELRLRIYAKVSIGREEVRKKNVFSVTDEIWLTDESEEVKERIEMEKVTETGPQWRVGLEWSTVLIVL